MKIYEFKCKDCGARKYEKVNEHTYRCEYCGYTEEVYISEPEPKKIEPEEIEVEEDEILTEQHEYKIPKFALLRMIMCIMFGYVGVHKFMEGKIFMGIIYIFTQGLFGIGYIVDIVSNISKFVDEYKKLNEKEKL